MNQSQHESNQDYRITSMSGDIKDLKNKLDTMDVKLRDLEIINVQKTAEITALRVIVEENTAAMKEERERVRTGWNRFFWIIGGAFLTTFVAWVFRGGLNG